MRPSSRPPRLGPWLRERAGDFRVEAALSARPPLPGGGRPARPRRARPPVARRRARVGGRGTLPTARAREVVARRGPVGVADFSRGRPHATSPRPHTAKHNKDMTHCFRCPVLPSAPFVRLPRTVPRAVRSGAPPTRGPRARQTRSLRSRYVPVRRGLTRRQISAALWRGGGLGAEDSRASLIRARSLGSEVWKGLRACAGRASARPLPILWPGRHASRRAGGAAAARPSCFWSVNSCRGRAPASGDSAIALSVRARAEEYVRRGPCGR